MLFPHMVRYATLNNIPITIPMIVDSKDSIFGELYMAKIKDRLLKEAIADAKAVRETALANAKLAITEAFTPKLQSMLSTKLRNEMEGDFDKNADEDLPTGLDDTNKVLDPTVAKEAKDVTGDAGKDTEKGKGGDVGPESGGQGLEKQGNSSLKLTEVGDEEEFPENSDEVPEVGAEVGAEVPGEDVGGEAPVDTVPPDNGDVSSPEGEEFPEEEDADVELEAIIKELEAEEEPEITEPIIGDEEEEEKLAPSEAKDVTADAGQDSEKGLAGDIGPESGSETAIEATPPANAVAGGDLPDDELEINLESLIKEIEAEMGDEEEEKKVQALDGLRNENTVLRKSLKEHRDVVIYLRQRLNEINLLNSKLLYSNRLFRDNSLNESQKLRIIESIDRANTVREVKLVYATLAEAIKTKSTVKLTESVKPKKSASDVVKSSKPATVLTEGNILAARFKELAGVKKISRIL